jgi:hypothetical protein
MSRIQLERNAARARAERAARPKPRSYPGRYEDDCGTPGPPPGGNGRAAVDVPRLDAPLFLPGEKLVVALPRVDGPGREAWMCEIRGVQLPLMPADPASVRVRLVERFRSEPPVKTAGRRKAAP